MSNSDKINSALQKAAEKTGASKDIIDFLKKTASIESASIPDKPNENSNAWGAWQLMPKTAIETARKYEKQFPELKGVTGSKGLTLDQQALITTLITIEHEKPLRDCLPTNIDIMHGDRYSAHFSGPGKAVEIIRAAPDTPLSNILSADAMKQNGIIYNNDGSIKSHGIRMKKPDGSTLYFKDFNAGDFRLWSHLKMEQPGNYEKMSEEERKTWRKSHGIPDSTPEALGSMAIIVGIAVALATLVVSLGGIFSSDDDEGPKPTRTPQGRGRLARGYS